MVEGTATENIVPVYRDGLNVQEMWERQHMPGVNDVAGALRSKNCLLMDIERQRSERQETDAKLDQ
jgi:hypothetical protein